jgi:hypothetical protein
MKKTIFMLIPILILLINVRIVFGQATNDTTAIYRIETNDGNEFIGKILLDADGKIMLRTEKLGVINIYRSDVKKIIKLDVVKMVEGRYWPENLQSARYFFAPTGYGLKAGEGYYQNVWVLFNQVSVGITDNISIGAGIVPLFLFTSEYNPVWLVPKFSIPLVKDKINVGGGAFMGLVTGTKNSGFGIVYGSSTFGTRDQNLTLGLGYGYAGGQWANTPLINISALIRTGPHGYFLTENYLIDAGETTFVLLSLGGRSIIKRTGLDYGLFIPLAEDMGGFIAIPWLGFSIPF